MPYIPKSDRKQYVSLIEELAALVPQDRAKRAGHLNFIITKLLHTACGNEMRYSDHNEAIGVLECAKLELYRRRTAPYEDQKIKEEGDV